MEKHTDVDRVWRGRSPELLGYIADVAAKTLQDVAGVDPERARYLGYYVMRSIAEHVGGQMIYIPKSDAIERCERDEAIWRDFTGHNHAELAKKYGITTMHVYRVIKRMRALAVERCQMAFGF